MLQGALMITSDIQTSVEQAEDFSSDIVEHIPKFQLRANKISNFEEHQVCEINTPVLAANTVTDLSPEQCEETFNFFLLSGRRLSQMTRTYHDIEAVMLLLEEKEKDLELAAHIGQTLLKKNKEIAQENEILELQLGHALEEASQLRHDITKKENLLHIYANDETDSSETCSPTKDMNLHGQLQVRVEGLQDKIQQLEQNNAYLLEERSLLFTHSKEVETEEATLVSDTIDRLDYLQNDLKKANSQIFAVTEELKRRNTEATKQQSEITHLLTQVGDLQQKHRDRNKRKKILGFSAALHAKGAFNTAQKATKLTKEHETLHLHLNSANKSQLELSEEVHNLEERYCEVLNMLDEARKGHLIRNSSVYSGDQWFDSSNSSSWQIPFHYSLAAELDEIRVDEDEQASKLQSKSFLHRNNYLKTEQCILQTAQYVNRCKITNFTLEDHNEKEKAVSSTQKIRKLNWIIGSPPSCRDIPPNIGQPGIPGTLDLERAIEKLAKVGREGLKIVHQTKSHVMCKTSEDCDPKHQYCSCPNCCSKCSGMFKGKHYPKLKVVKSLEGSVTLHQWKSLADTLLYDMDQESCNNPGIVLRSNISQKLRTETSRNIDVITTSNREVENLRLQKSLEKKHISNIHALTDSLLEDKKSVAETQPSKIFTSPPALNQLQSSPNSNIGYPHLNLLHQATRQTEITIPSMRLTKSNPHLPSLAAALDTETGGKVVAFTSSKKADYHDE